MMITRLLAATTLIALAAPASAACSAIGKHDAAALNFICDSEAGWAASVASGDTSVVKRILAEDFIGVDPDGKHYRKSEMVADTAKAPNYFASNHINDVIVRFYGNMAIAQGSETWHRKKGKPADGRFVWTDTWLKRNGKWEILAAEDLIAPVK
jgi:ketosteroid isomerase-like protein